MDDPLKDVDQQVVIPWFEREEKILAKQKKVIRRGSKDFENVGEGEIKAGKIYNHVIEKVHEDVCQKD